MTVNHRSTSILLMVMIILSLALSACQGADPAQAQPEPGYNAMKISAPDCSYGGEIQSIEAINSATVRFTLCYPDAGFPAKVAFPTFAIQDTNVLNNSSGNPDEIVATGAYSGPFRVKQWNPGTSLVLEPNPTYWGIPARLDELTIRWAPSSGMRQAELQAKRADLIDQPDLRSLVIRTDPNYTLYTRPSLNVAYIGMNRSLPPFDNDQVRLAFAMIFNRDQMVETSFPVGSVIAQQFVPSTLTPGYSPVLRWHDMNHKEARELLKEANFDFSQTITMLYSSESTPALPSPNLVAFEVQTQLKELGIKVRLQRLTRNEVQAALDSGQVALYIDGFSADFPDATSFYDLNFIQNAQRFGTPYEDLVAAIQAASREPDAGARQLAYDRVNELLKNYALFIPIAHANSTLASLAQVGNVMAGPINESFSLMTTPSNTMTFFQETAPTSLWAADETSADTMRVGYLLYSSLTQYGLGGKGVEPALAEYWYSNEDLSEWTFDLRYGVAFSNGATLDANDVVATFAAQWDASNPNHAGQYSYFKRFFGEFLNHP